MSPTARAQYVKRLGVLLLLLVLQLCPRLSAAARDIHNDHDLMPGARLWPLLWDARAPAGTHKLWELSQTAATRTQVSATRTQVPPPSQPAALLLLLLHAAAGWLGSDYEAPTYTTANAQHHTRRIEVRAWVQQSGGVM